MDNEIDDLQEKIKPYLPHITRMYNTYYSTVGDPPTVLYVPVGFVNAFAPFRKIIGLQVRFGSHWEVV